MLFSTTLSGIAQQGVGRMTGHRRSVSCYISGSSNAARLPYLCIAAKQLLVISARTIRLANTSFQVKP